MNKYSIFINSIKPKMAFQTRQQIALSTDRSAIYGSITQQSNSIGADGKPAGQNGYTYNTMEYPIGELGSQRYPHFMLIYVNINSKTKLVKPRSADNLQTNTNATFQTQGQNSVELNATSGTSTAAVARDSTVMSKMATLAGGVASHKRITTAICLPMPQQLRANYGAAYSETEEVGILGATLTALSSGQGAWASGGSAYNTLAQVGVPGVVAAGTSALQQTGASVLGKVSGDAGKALANAEPINSKLLEQIGSKLVGTVINQRQEQLFKKMEFRQHHYQWLFLPRSKEESEIIFQICKTLKTYMHPELDQSTANSTLIMPAEFDISFQFGDKENDRISKVATSVLTSVEVDYTAIHEFITFEGYADPIAISLSLMFKELEPLSAGMIKDGGF